MSSDGTQSDDFFEVVTTARSVRRRLDYERPVPAALIERCIEAAVQAPTGLNRESWRFVVITDPEPKAALAALYRASMDRLTERAAAARPAALADTKLPGERPTYVGLAENLQRMPALILVCSLGRPSPDSHAMQVAYYGSILPAAWSLMLALRASGLGTTWTTLLADEEEAVARVLGIPEDVGQTVLLPVAWTKEAVLRPAKRKGPKEVTYWNAWEAPRPSDDD